MEPPPPWPGRPITCSPPLTVGLRAAGSRRRIMENSRLSRTSPGIRKHGHADAVQELPASVSQNIGRGRHRGNRPADSSRSVFGANDRIAVGFIGVGNQGSGNLKAFLRKNIAVPAISDVDSQRSGTALELLQKQGIRRPRMETIVDCSIRRGLTPSSSPFPITGMH